MKDKLIELMNLSKETVGASCTLSLLKNGKFRVQFLQDRDPFPVPEDSDPEVAVTSAIMHIKAKRQPLEYNPHNKQSITAGSTHTMKKTQFA